MAFNAVSVLMLISAPSDVPIDDLAIVKKTVSQWNLSTGRPSGVTVVPVSWSEHAVAEFGDRPQSVINGQLTDEADMAIAIFADRLGTPTGSAESGTLEEIERLVDAGKHVSVLVNQAPRSMHGEAAVAEKARLEKALTGLRDRAIVLSYADSATLVGHLNNMLSMAAGAAAAAVRGVGASGSGAVSEEAVGVWPHLRSESYQETDNKGRLKTKRRQYIEVQNQTGRPVRDVSLELADPPVGWHGDEGPVNLMPPGGVKRYAIMAMMATGPINTEATVTWRFETDDEPRQSVASLS